MPLNSKYSFRDFTGKSLRHLTPEQLAGEIAGSCFFQENEPDCEVFPPDLQTTFVRCNLDNVKVPAGCKMIDCTNKRIMVQNDGQDWEVDEKHQPVKPLHPEMHEELGLSTDPKDLPADYVIEETLTKEEFESLKKADWEAPAEKGPKPPRSKAFWFREVPKVVKDDGKMVTVRGKGWLYRGQHRQGIVGSSIPVARSFH